jgi:hypothetical protein
MDCSGSILAIVAQIVDGGSFHKRLWFIACPGVGVDAETEKRGWCRGKAVGVPRVEEDQFFMPIRWRQLCRENFVVVRLT